MGPEVPGDIPWTVLRAWADYYGMTRGEFALFDRCIQALDVTYREVWMSRQKKEQEAGELRSGEPS